jgi:hypothetical protein
MCCCLGQLWTIPEGGLKENMSNATAKFDGLLPLSLRYCVMASGSEEEVLIAACTSGFEDDANTSDFDLVSCIACAANSIHDLNVSGVSPRPVGHFNCAARNDL